MPTERCRFCNAPDVPMFETTRMISYQPLGSSSLVQPRAGQVIAGDGLPFTERECLLAEGSIELCRGRVAVPALRLIQDAGDACALQHAKLACLDVEEARRTAREEDGTAAYAALDRDADLRRTKLDGLPGNQTSERSGCGCASPESAQVLLEADKITSLHALRHGRDLRTAARGDPE